MSRPMLVVRDGHGYVHEMASPQGEATVVLHDVLHQQKRQTENWVGDGNTTSGMTVFGCVMTAADWESRAVVSRRISMG